MLAVTAIDHDRQRVRYTRQLTEDESELPFAVDPESGAITTNNPITLNWPHKYLFEVIAEDNNQPAKGRATAFVAVNIYNTSHLLILKSCNSTQCCSTTGSVLELPTRLVQPQWIFRLTVVHNITEPEADESK